MKVLLTHGYYLLEDEKETKIMRPYPPLGLLYVSGYLEQVGLTHSVFDSTYSSYHEHLKYIKKNKPEIIAIYTNLMTKINILKFVKEVKSKVEYGQPTIILGGPDVTYNLENYLKSGIDFIIIGEGEETCAELCNAILKDEETITIPGIAFMEGGEVIKTLGRQKIKDLSTLPLPNRNAIKIEKYLKTWKTHHGKSSMTISTQRGCPYTCKWCSTAVYGQSYRRRPAKLVVQEMAMLKEQYNPDAIWFVDDVFTVSHKWMDAFFEEIENQKVLIPFECITRAERLNKDILKKMKKAGCFRIWIGAESGSQKIVDHMDRRVDIDHVKETIQLTNSLGMESGTFVMLGYPTETMDDIKKTIQYLIDANPTQFTITKAYPIKGTSLYEEVQAKITTPLEWNKSTDRDIDFVRTYKSEFYNHAIPYVLGKIDLALKKRKATFTIRKRIGLTIRRIKMSWYMAIS